MEGELIAVELADENMEAFDTLIGGNGNRWLCFFVSSVLPAGDSGAVPPDHWCIGVTLPLCILELGPGLVI